MKVSGIFFDVSLFSQNRESDAVPYADITIPYGTSDLNGYPEKALAAVSQDKSSNDRWDPVPSTVDSVRHQIVVHLTSVRFKLIQVYVKSDSVLAAGRTKTPTVLGIRANFSGQKQCMAVHFSLPAAETAELRLYDLKGKCLRKNSFAANAGSSTLQWNLGGIANGKYIACMSAGRYHEKQSVLIMK